MSMLVVGEGGLVYSEPLLEGVCCESDVPLVGASGLHIAPVDTRLVVLHFPSSGQGCDLQLQPLVSMLVDDPVTFLLCPETSLLEDGVPFLPS